MQMMSKCKCLNLDLLNSNEFYGHFVFTSLDKGEGTTIGNMLRRALLSNLYGFRITGVRVKGINNEFTPLDGVREDLLEIILNLKEIIISNENKTGQSCFGRLKVQGPAIITAGALALPDGIKVVNPSSHLLTISDKSIIELETKIEYGKSYMLAKDQKLSGLKDFIPIDSNFAPVLKVNFYSKSLEQNIENTKEELHLEIFTNGTILPNQALIEARNILGYLLSPITSIEFPCLDSVKISDKIATKQRKSLIKKSQYVEDESEFLREKILAENKTSSSLSSEERLLERVADMESGSLEGLGLSNRIIKVLNKANIIYTWDLMQYPSENLITIEGLGPKSVEEINKKLALFF
uniref:RNA polymerase alpha subunit n=1 Tax=Scytothamnus australis TaxID=66621 RepID=UPI002E780158|nr:RNA polymerase alpha subunit [Scytothamnus australis]WAM64686.1 RNA polymerase alpha subunit [Scytothamnus australis]